VTNLFNTVQPLIRYRLQDRLTQRAAAGDGHLRADVEGRAATVFDYGDASIHPLVIATPLTRQPNVVDFQVHQTARGVTVDLITDGAVDTDDLTTALTAALAGAGRTNPTVEVRIVTALTRDGRTGKLAQFVPARPG
jgi:phenylacetate-coenzyme A ligase PaaK-like adenylate-forming protein